MANIAFLGNFRVDYSTEFHHAASLQALGHNVIKLQETKATSEEILKVALESDLFVWVHTHGWNTPGDLSMARVLKRIKAKNIPTMTYHLDLWLGLGRESDLDKDPVYKYIDHFFTVDKQMADWFDKNTEVKGHYLPAGVFHEECYIKPSRKILDVIFVGSKGYHQEWPYRPKLVNWLQSTYKKRFRHYGRDGVKSIRGAELNSVYAATKVVVGDTLCPNFNYPSYWSDRIYETLGRGGFLIHPYIPGLEKEFKDKEHVVFYQYNNFEQLNELIDYYLEHEEEREAIRQAGHLHVKQNYTYKNRWEQILKELGI
jgi:glycosyltransferase involved in cell wall biosynthesis